MCSSATSCTLNEGLFVRSSLACDIILCTSLKSCKRVCFVAMKITCRYIKYSLLFYNSFWDRLWCARISFPFSTTFVFILVYRWSHLSCSLFLSGFFSFVSHQIADIEIICLWLIFSCFSFFFFSRQWPRVNSSTFQRKRKRIEFGCGQSWCSDTSIGGDTTRSSWNVEFNVWKCFKFNRQ